MRKESHARMNCQKYEPVHSSYSSWIAEKILQKREGGIDYKLLDKILSIIYGHHSRVHRSIGEIKKSEKFKFTQQAMVSNSERFRNVSSAQIEFSGLSWNHCIARFQDPISFDSQLRSASIDPVDDFLEVSVACSCLLQADRGSFSDWYSANFDIIMDILPN